MLIHGAPQLPVWLSRPSGKRGSLTQIDIQNATGRFDNYERAVLRTERGSFIFHKQPNGTGTANGKDETKVQRLLSSAQECRSLLPQYLPAVHGHKGYNTLSAIHFVLVGKLDIQTG